MSFAWGSDAGGWQHRNFRQAEEREGLTPLDRPLPGVISDPDADTAVSIERKVVSGHAYAILAPHADSGGRCGKDKPANVSVNGVSTCDPGPRRFRAGALVSWRGIYGPI
ncbi:hypothetical protein Apa02nite_083690 [Actinoplanes palleronii]|uniref:Uncharacterized protein n=1 Tax=Actinoplanes palleronii TaxID=113570 RepID=A0ABQ4BNL7_9ACTN|nr:hypothetical protein Apa02nite_083690 [Actinoplanes palleronii]